MKRIALVCALSLLMWAPPAQAQWAVSRYSVSTSAGVTSSGGSYRLMATLGQAVIGAQGRLQAGLWPGSRGIVTSVEPRDPAEVPTLFHLHGNYPNPFNPSTSVRFDLPEPAQVRLAVFDVLGRQMLALPEQAFAAGTGHVLRIDGAVLSSGMYIYHVTATATSGTHVAAGQMLLVK